MSKMKVGQKLWYVPSGRLDARGPRTITVTRVGRKWATCQDGYFETRIDMETLLADGGGGGNWVPGGCYLSQADHKEAVDRENLWREIHATTETFGGRPIPHNLTSADLREIAAKLRGEEPAA